MSASLNEGDNEVSRFVHNVYNNDPVLFKSYVNKRVSVMTEDGTVQSGIVYTVDPVSESIVLIETNEDQQYDLKIVLGHAIKNIELSSEPLTIIPELFMPEKTSGQKSSKRKEAVKKLLLESRFPVTEKEDILYIKDTIRIEPPYGLENCISTNSTILSRVQKIISTVLD